MTIAPREPSATRRTFLQAGGIGLLGLSLPKLAEGVEKPAGRSVIFIFLSGGLSQLESFDLKPDGPEASRGEFKPAATSTPGLFICEHLPKFAARSNLWSVVRSLGHASNDHDPSHLLINSGRSTLPAGFQPKPYESRLNHPSMASIATYATRGRSGLPPAVMLPFLMERPGNLAGALGSRHDPWVVSGHACKGCGDCPNCFEIDAKPGHQHTGTVLPAWGLTLPEGLTESRLEDRRRLLSLVDAQRREFDGAAVRGLSRQRENAYELLTTGQVRAAFDLNREPEQMQEAYGKNLFGRSLMLSRRLVEAGVGLVQVHLGRTTTWDQHAEIFTTLKGKLFPPMDLAVTALLEDLAQRGILDRTLVVMASEFGRTPYMQKGPKRPPGRDHWGAVQSVLFAGGGVSGGRAVGSSDRKGAYPATNPKTPENLAATVYHVLGIPKDAVWRDAVDRPHPIYHGGAIDELW